MKTIWGILLLLALFEFGRMFFFEPEKLNRYLANGLNGVPLTVPAFKDPNKEKEIKAMRKQAAEQRLEGLRFLRSLKQASQNNHL